VDSTQSQAEGKQNPNYRRPRTPTPDRAESMSSKDIGEYPDVMESFSQDVVRTGVFNFRQVNLISDDLRGCLMWMRECPAADHDRCRE